MPDFTKALKAWAHQRLAREVHYRSRFSSINVWKAELEFYPGASIEGMEEDPEFKVHTVYTHNGKKKQRTLFVLCEDFVPFVRELFEFDFCDCGGY